jgi:2-keto-4-pentenoate hydratase/2-oxohepta-3-ene-1,7-dioic acid hydratase in catechol pathway
MKPPVYLKDGDVCEVEIEKIGAIRNRMRALA